MPKRKDGRYEVTIQINKKRKHFLGNTLKEAKEKRDRYIELMEKCPLATNKILLKEWMSAWLETVKTNISPVTYKNYYYTVKKYVQNTQMGNILLQNLTPAMFRSYFSDLLKEKSPRTVNNLHNILHVGLKQAAEDGAIPVSPLTNIKHAKIARDEIKTLSKEQLHQMIDLLPEEWMKCYFRIATYTGLRMGEISGLDYKKSFDFEKGTLSVIQSIIKAGREERISTDLKTKSSRRTISVDTETLNMIHGQIARVLKLKMQNPNFKDNGLLFCRTDGSPIRRNHIEKISRRTFNKMGLTGITFHSLRHTHATMLLKAGVHHKLVQYRLGHSSFQVTMDIYSHVTPEMESGIMQSLNKII